MIFCNKKIGRGETKIMSVPSSVVSMIPDLPALMDYPYTLQAVLCCAKTAHLWETVLLYCRIGIFGNCRFILSTLLLKFGKYMLSF